MPVKEPLFFLCNNNKKLIHHNYSHIHTIITNYGICFHGLGALFRLFLMSLILTVDVGYITMYPSDYAERITTCSSLSHRHFS